jgi:EAL domain-containing protein (putative c-di-GMP-specific phosphodiesterase class I)
LPGGPSRRARHDQSLLESLLDVMEYSTCVVNSDGDIVATNRAWRQASSGAGGSGLPVDGPYRDVWAPASGDYRLVAEKISVGLELLLSGESDKFSIDYAFASGGKERWISLRITPLPEISGAVLSHVDISAATLSARAMSYQSLHDPLTQLPNRDLLGGRLFDALARPFAVNGSSIAVSASIGVAVSVPSQSPDDLLQAADAAMAEAKSRGPGHITLHSDALQEGIHLRLRTEVELREALKHDELVLHYQPVVDLKRGVTTGVEALVRWQRADGLRMPDTFIPAAEASGLIVPMGVGVLQEACHQGALWRRQGLDLDVAVNLSARQVTHPDVVGTVQETLRRSGLPPQRLMVEVTESTVMEDADAAEVALRAIAALGVAVAIDDFGTGYSSLVYLKRYQLHALKVDRSFVAGMGINAEDDAIVASIINLAGAVGAVCIAEGVETHEQHAALTALGCDYAQGFLFGRPVPAGELGQALADCARVLAAQPLARTDLPGP